MLEKHVRPLFQGSFDRLGQYLLKIPLSANQATLQALFSGFVSALCLGMGYPKGAVVFLWFSGLFDVLDGAIARLSNTYHPLDAYCDLIMSFTLIVLVSGCMRFVRVKRASFEKG